MYCLFIQYVAHRLNFDLKQVSLTLCNAEGRLVKHSDMQTLWFNNSTYCPIILHQCALSQLSSDNFELYNNICVVLLILVVDVVQNYFKAIKTML